MNSLLWIAQILLACVFIYAGFSKVFVGGQKLEAAHTHSTFGCVGLPSGWAAAIALLEVAGALCVVAPVDLWPPDILPRLAAGALALLAIVMCVHHARRKESTAPLIAVILLAIFVIVGRWPR